MTRPVVAAVLPWVAKTVVISAATMLSPTMTSIAGHGQEDGTIREDVDPIDAQLLVNSLSFFRIANQHTFGVLYGRLLASDAERDHLRTLIGDAVVRMFAAEKSGPVGAPSA